MNIPRLYQLFEKLPINGLRFFINLWPPFLATGIYVTKITPDIRHIEVALKLHWYNKNYVSVHFGGSLFLLADPFYMWMLIRNLGKDYIVWDKQATIDFKKPGLGTLHASFTFTEEEIQSIRKQVDEHHKCIFDKTVDIINEQGTIVTSVVKTLYVRKRRETS